MSTLLTRIFLYIKKNHLNHSFELLYLIKLNPKIVLMNLRKICFTWGADYTKIY